MRIFVEELRRAGHDVGALAHQRTFWDAWRAVFALSDDELRLRAIALRLIVNFQRLRLDEREFADWMSAAP